MTLSASSTSAFATQFGMRVPPSPMCPHTRAAKLLPSSWSTAKAATRARYAVYTGLLYATAGAVVVTYDPAGEFERSVTRGSETGEHDKPIPGLTNLERVGGLMIEDAQQAVRYAASRTEVDPTRIAVIGYSMGSFHTILAAALAGPQLPKIRAVLLSGGGNLDGSEQYWDTGHAVNCQAAPYRALDFFPGGGDARGPILYALRALYPPRSQRYRDRFITNQRAEPSSLIFAGRSLQPGRLAHQLAGDLLVRACRPPPQLHDSRGRALARYAPTSPTGRIAQIEVFLTVRAIDWVTNWRPHLLRGYQNEQKEGGIFALNLHLPGLTREQLTAVPEAEEAAPLALHAPWLDSPRLRESTASSSVQSKDP